MCHGYLGDRLNMCHGCPGGKLNVCHGCWVSSKRVVNSLIPVLFYTLGILGQILGRVGRVSRTALIITEKNRQPQCWCRVLEDLPYRVRHTVVRVPIPMFWRVGRVVTTNSWIRFSWQPGGSTGAQATFPASRWTHGCHKMVHNGSSLVLPLTNILANFLEPKVVSGF